MNDDKFLEWVKEGKNFSLYFYKKDCVWCEQLSPYVSYELPKGKYNKKKLPLYQINQSEHREIIKELEVKTFPQLVIIQGKEFVRLKGLNEIKEYLVK